jgi:hypothetical protein
MDLAIFNTPLPIINRVDEKQSVLFNMLEGYRIEIVIEWIENGIKTATLLFNSIAMHHFTPNYNLHTITSVTQVPYKASTLHQLF